MACHDMMYSAVAQAAGKRRARGRRVTESLTGSQSPGPMINRLASCQTDGTQRPARPPGIRSHPGRPGCGGGCSD
eukprot:758828-Hanusia_phi.AAC.1